MLKDLTIKLLPSPDAVRPVTVLEAKLLIDGKEIPLNEFVKKILSGTIEKRD